MMLLGRAPRVTIPALAAAAQWKAGRRMRSAAQRRRAMRVRPPGNPARWRADAHFFQFGDIERRSAEYRSFLCSRFADSARQALEQADRAEQHVFDLLGSGPVALGEKIDWHQDFKSGRVWEKRYFADIPEIDLDDSSDIKVPWELSRFYHAVSLGKAYFLTGLERYARELVDQITDWQSANEPWRGVNWHCAMEVAVRAVNWLWGWHFIRRSRAATADFSARLAASLHEHGIYIERNLEFDRRLFEGRYVRMNHNHYLADLVGLAYLGVALDGRDADRWLRFASRELDLEIGMQFLPDGVHWELSTSYHRLAAEMCMSAAILLAPNGFPLSPRSLQLLAESLVFIQRSARADGLSPLARDADDGRLHILGCRPRRDHRALLSVGAGFFARSDLARGSGGLSEDTLWLLGLERARMVDGMGDADPPTGSCAFPHAQYFVMRAPPDVHVFVSCAGIGMKGAHGGHAHNDCLSFEAFAQGAPIITDSGTYVYSADPARRNRFRSTAAHNTVRVDGEEINRFAPSVLFGMENDARPVVTEWQTTPARDRLSAQHAGYERLAEPVTCRRSFLLEKESGLLFITDELIGWGEHRVEVFLHLAPGTALTEISPGLFRIAAGEAEALAWFPDAGQWAIRIEGSEFSPSYGVLRKNAVIRAETRRTVPVVFRCALGLGRAWAQADEAAAAGRRMERAAQALADELPDAWGKTG